jgi:superfamily I DNA/RNA helicase
LIVHKSQASLLLCYVDHHDAAYTWAERRKLERHPTTGAAQLVEVREMVKEIMVPVYVPEETAPPAKPRLFDHLSEEELLSYGVPADWVGEVKDVNEDSLLILADRLPREAAEALLELATGGKPQPAVVTPEEEDPFIHPDAQSRFRVMEDKESLEAALEFPWEKWTLFLHPSQKELVERDHNGPARVSGSAGTGKTIVALHRAVTLVSRDEDTRVLLTTFSEPLAAALRTRLHRLIHSRPRLAERVDVESLETVALRLAKARLGKRTQVTDHEIQRRLTEAAKALEGTRFTEAFLWQEWSQVVDAWQVKQWEDYRDVKRLGRKTRLSETQRETLWNVFKQLRSDLDSESLCTLSDIYAELTDHFSKKGGRPYDAVVVDEAQDISVQELRFLAAMSGGQENGLFFAGDLGQRIFRQPFSWASLGVDVRGRATTLRVNYRTSHQIRRHADKLLPPELEDVDGNAESRLGTVSVFNGPEPKVQVYDSEEQEQKAVADWIRERFEEGLRPIELGIFVRSESQRPRAEAVTKQLGYPARDPLDASDNAPDTLAIGTMHLAKGLEYRAVVVMACDDEVIPLQERIETVGDTRDLEEVYNTERNLLYVACTRARDHLLITATDPASEFLEDF